MKRTPDAVLRKLKEMHEKLTLGDNIPNREFKRWLGHERYAEYESGWEEQKGQRDLLKDKPEAVTEYEKLLRDANFIYNKAEGLRGEKHSRTRQQLYYDAEAAYERALEHLEEQSQFDPSFQMWFDRNIHNTEDNDIGPSPAGMPRVVTSRSLDNQRGGWTDAIKKKHELKLEIVEQAIGELESPVEIDKDVQSAKLKEMIRKLKKN